MPTVRLIPYYTQIIEYTQAQENALASALTGHPAGEQMHYNTTLSIVRYWNGTAFESSPTIMPEIMPTATATLKGSVPATGTPSGKFLKDDLTWAAAGGGAFNGTLDDINTGLTNVHLTTTLKSTYDAKVETNDARLSDARTPLTHNHTGVYAPVLGADDNYVTDAQKVIIVNTSNTNTGDNSANTLYGGLATSKQDTLVSATNIKTVNSNSLLGAGDLVVTGASEYLAKLVLAANKATGANVTPVTLGLSFNYIANKKYIIDIYALVAPAVATTGCGFLIDVSTAVTYVGTFVSHQLAVTGTISGAGSVGDLAATSSGISSGMVLAAAGGNNFVLGGGIVVTGANAGTATFFFRSETTAVTTCMAGTCIRVMEI